MKTIVFDGSYRLTSDFEDHINSGPPRSNFPGVDFATPIGTELLAPDNGVVYNLKDVYGAFYTMVRSEQADWFYVHLNGFKGSSGRRVRKGEIIGYAGNTGYSFGAHTHVGYRRRTNNKYIDPLPFITIKMITDPLYEQLKKDRKDLENLSKTEMTNWWNEFGLEAFIFRLGVLSRADVINASQRGEFDFGEWYVNFGANEYDNIWTDVISHESLLNPLLDDLSKIINKYKK